MGRAVPQVRGAFIATLVGASAAVIGAFGPWIEGLGGLVSRSGIDNGGDGWIIVAAAVLAGLILYRAYSYGTWNPWGLLIVGGLATFIGAYDFEDVANRGASTSVGWGIVLATAGPVVIALAGLSSVGNRRTRAKALEAEQVAVPATMPPPTSQPPAGWYTDPQGSGASRWWDGSRWTEHTQAAASD